MDLNRRQALGLGAAAITAGVVDAFVPDIEFFGNLERLENPEEKIAKFKALYDRDPSYKKKGGSVRELANREVNNSEGLNRREYATNFFESTETVMPQIIAKNENADGSMRALRRNWFENFETIPEGTRLSLAQLVTGQIAQESKFDNSAYNKSSKARTLWQIIPAVYRDEAREDSNTMAAMTVSTKVAFYNYERIYTVLHNGVEIRSAGIDVPGFGEDGFNDFKAHFGLNESQWENFLALVMLNAYNTGERRMLEIMHWFRKNYSLRELAETKDHTELGLFSLMTDLAFNNPKFNGYREDSSQYVFASLGAGESLKEREVLDFSEIDTPGTFIGDAVNKVGEQVTQIGIPIVAGVAAYGAVRSDKRRKKNLERVDKIDTENEKVEPQPKGVSRRKFLLSSAAAGGAAAAGIMTNRSEAPSSVWKWVSDVLNPPEKEARVEFPDGTFYAPETVSQLIEQNEGRFFANRDFNGVSRFRREADKALPRRNYTASGFLAWFVDQEEGEGLERYTKVSQIREAVSRGDLSKLEEVSDQWRAHNVKGGRGGVGRNNPDYLALRPEALVVLEEITEKFQQKIEEAGLESDTWHVRPKIESLIRDVRGGSDYSPHQFGLGIDFPFNRAFDLVHVPSKNFTVLAQGDNNGLYSAVQGLFMETLKQVHDENKNVIVTRESNPPHIHLAVKF